MSLIFKTLLPGILFLGSFIAHTQPLNAVQEQSSGPVWKKQGNNWRLYDEQGNLLTPEAFSMHGEKWNNNYTWVEINKKYGIIDHNGKNVIPPIYDNIITTLYEAGVMVEGNGKWGFVSWQNDTLLPFRYDIVGSLLDNGLIGVNIGGRIAGEDGLIIGGKWGYINISGQEVCPVKYDYIGSEWKEGIVWVNIGGLHNSINHSINNGKFGLVDSTGTEIVPPLFGSVEEALKAFQQGIGNLYEITDTIPDMIWNY